MSRKKTNYRGKKLALFFGLGVITTITPIVGVLAGCGCGQSPKSNQEKFDSITGDQVLDAIVQKYPQFSKSQRGDHSPSEFDVFNVPSFTATINTLEGVQVSFSNIFPSNPGGQTTTSTTLTFETTISYPKFSSRQMGFLKLGGFKADTVLTAKNVDELSSLETTTLTINPGVTVVQYVFSEKTYGGVTHLNLPDSLNVIEKTSFASLHSLESLDLKNVRFLGEGAFLESPLSTLAWPNVQDVGASAFEEAQLTSFEGNTLPSKITLVGANAFYSSPLTGTLTVPNSLQEVGASAFRAAKLTGLITDKVGSQLTTIGAGAFESSEITELILPNNLLTIGSRAFAESPLTNIALGSKIQEIGDLAFFGTYSIRSLVVPASVVSIGEWSFGSAQITKLTFSSTSSTPSHLTTIGARAFFYATLSTLTVPQSVTFIGESAFASAYLGKLLFAGPYRDNLALQDGAFGNTNPDNISPVAWQKIAKKFPNAFYSEGSLLN